MKFEGRLKNNYAGLEIRERLVGLQLTPTREAAIIEELSQHLDDCYEDLLVSGATADEAYRQTLGELSESELLQQKLRRVERQVAPEPIVLGTNRRTVESHDIVDKFLIDACPTTSWTFLPHSVFAIGRRAAKSPFHRLFDALAPRT